MIKDTLSTFTTKLGHSYLKALLLEGNVDIKIVSKDMQWKYPRIYSMLKTIAKHGNRELIKVKTSIYKLEEKANEK